MLAVLHCSSARAWPKRDTDPAASNNAKEMPEKALLHDPTSVEACSLRLPTRT